MIRLPRSLLQQTNRCCTFRSLLISPGAGGGCVCTTRVCACSCSGVRFASNDRGEKFNPEDDLKNPSTRTSRKLAKKVIDTRQEQACLDQKSSASTRSNPTTSTPTATNVKEEETEAIGGEPVLKNRAYIEINLFGPKDARASLPGNVGPCPKKYDRHRKSISPQPPIQEFRLITNHTKNQNNHTTTTIERLLYSFETIDDRQHRVLENVAYNFNADFDLSKQFSQIKSYLDVRVFECPELVNADLKKIFFAKSLEKLDILMITINRQSSSDLDVPPDLIGKTAELIEQLCEMLNKAGYWSDYITGPQIVSSSSSSSSSSSKINFDLNYVSANSIETCERYRCKSFQVQKLQDCKLIQYETGEGTFMGSIFTNAGLDAKPLKVILEKILNV